MENQKKEEKTIDEEAYVSPQVQPAVNPQAENQSLPIDSQPSKLASSDLPAASVSDKESAQPVANAETGVQPEPKPVSSVKPEPSITFNPQPQDQAQTSVNSTKPPKKSKKKLIIAIFVVLLIVGAGAAAAVYTYLNNKPEKVLADALANTAADILERKPSSAIGEMKYESKGDNPVKLTVKFSGKNSGDNGEGNADISLIFAKQTYNIKSSAVVFGEDEAYFKLENLKTALAKIAQNQPAFGQYSSMVDPIITKIDNRWIKITKDDFKKAGLADEEKVDKCTDAISKLKLSGADKNELKKIFKSNQFMVAREMLPNETVSDESSFHYKLDFNNQTAQNFTNQIINMESFKTVKTDCEISDKTISDGFKQTKAASNHGESTKPVVELWVGKKSRRPTKVRVQAFDKQASIDFVSEVKIDAKNITIKKPENSLSITELQSEIDKLMPTNTSTL